MNTPQRRVILFVLIVLGITAVFAQTPPIPTHAAISCSDDSWLVSNETELNAAIACYNNKPYSGSSSTFTITLTQNILLTSSTPTIDNYDHDLVLEGAGFTLDGQNIVGLQPLKISQDTVQINNITITGGNATGNGGGIYSGEGVLTIINSTIKHNSATGNGGGIANIEGHLTINNSTISNNSAEMGGGVYNIDNLTIENSTISNNSANFKGGGIYNLQIESRPFNLNDSTVSNNSAADSGGGVFNENGVMNVSNSIIANSGSGGDCVFTNDLGFGAINDNGNNIVEDNSCGFTGGTDPQLGPLQHNGGSTLTHALLPGSPAIDNGSSSEATDQRGIVRPQGSSDDIGAYEVSICSPQPWPITNEHELALTINDCYNRQTIIGTSTISLTQDIDLAHSTPIINNTTSGVRLLLAGNGFTVDAQGQENVRPYQIAANTHVTIQDHSIANGNAADNGSNGGAIINSGTLTLTHSSIYSSTAASNGGGVYNNLGTLKLLNSTFHHNSAFTGGGIYNVNSSVLTIDNSTLHDNSALDLGGGIYNNNSTLNMTNSTLSRNSASAHGGGIVNASGTTTINSSTLSENAANIEGGGIRGFSGTTSLSNTIVANSSAGGDCFLSLGSPGSIIDNGSNIVEDNSCGFTGGADPKLGPLQDNGGVTLTHALLTGSPALDSGDTSLTVDQRGIARPSGLADDIGAYELDYCNSLPWHVGNEAYFNLAIACFNAKTSTGTYTISFAQDILLSSSSTAINNANSGVQLLIEGNRFTLDGQGINGVRPLTIEANTTVTIQNSTITRGSTTALGGGISNSGNLTVMNSTISNNATTLSGGGVTNNTASSELFIYHSTVSGNSAAIAGGGLLNFAGTIITENSTISGNSASSDGGGIYNAGTFTMTNNTITDNRTETTGGGIASASGASYLTSVSNSIVSGNVISTTSTADDLALVLGITDSFTSEGYNLIGNIDANITAFNQTGDQTNITDPKLGPLQDNGGATFTHAWLAGSPAIDAGNTTLTSDQRHAFRPQGLGDDIGAYEAFDCSTQSWPISSEFDLNTAIGCFNSKSISGTYVLTLTQNISLTEKTTAIDNANAGIHLLIEGAGYAMDGQGIEGVRPLTINSDSTVTIQNSNIIRGNMTADYGGGIQNNGALTLHNSTLAHNSAEYGGGIDNKGTLTMSHSTLNGNMATNRGGGMNNTSSLSISNSTLSDNSAVADGGGINHGTGTVTISSSTLSGNSASANGGGIRIASGVFSLDNSIIANSPNGGDCSRLGIADTINDNGYNIVEDNSCFFTGGSDPLLGPLQDNGGPNFTHALLSGSPAIDTGNTILTQDQRGIARPQGSNDDIGTFEAVQYTLTINKNGTSTGVVTSSPANIDCGSVCTSNFLESTVITLTATADSNTEFIGWDGAGCSGTGTCVVTMDAAKSVSATFNASYKIYLPTILK